MAQPTAASSDDSQQLSTPQGTEKGAATVGDGSGAGLRSGGRSMGHWRQDGDKDEEQDGICRELNRSD